MFLPPLAALPSSMTVSYTHLDVYKRQVFVTLPAVGFDGPSMRANAWQIQQALAAGAHGVLICEMHSPEAGEIAISCARTKYTLPGIPYLPIEGSRGSGSQVFAAHVWGLSGTDYLAVADTWPLNPKGEISMGFKRCV